MMADVRTGEFSRYRSNLLDAQADLHWWLWDCGPTEPELPEAPEAPSGKEGEPKYDLAKLQYRRELKKYEAALEKYEADSAAYEKWMRDNGGPIEIAFWSVDAKEALENDARAVRDGRQQKARYHISARTPGHGRLKNGGLPAGMKPGHGHQANLERQIAGEKEFVEALKADPVFGQEMRP
jgi:hypothetical protein